MAKERKEAKEEKLETSRDLHWRLKKETIFMVQTASVAMEATTHSLGALAKFLREVGPNKGKILKAEEASSRWKKTASTTLLDEKRQQYLQRTNPSC